MTRDRLSAKDAVHLLDQLRQGRIGDRSVVEPTDLDPDLQLLRRWQVERLAGTYADVLESERYGPAAEFFISDVYGPGDFSQRDSDLTTVYDSMRRVLPGRALHTLSGVIDLNELTKELDQALLDVLCQKLNMDGYLSEEMYAEAYRICDNYDERRQQIELVIQVGKGVDRLVRLPFVGLTLRLAHGPATRAGWSEVQTFLEKGYAVFKNMKGVAEFLEVIRRREMQILDQIFDAATDPFLVDV